MARSHVKNPAEIVRPGQKVLVRVISIDESRKRIGLSMKDLASPG
jgi:ribosomal protein S1